MSHRPPWPGPFSEPTPEEQIRFLGNIQRLLTEGRFVSSYKFALLQALTDLAVLHGDDSGAPLRLPMETIVERMVELYWRQAVPFAGVAVLRQSTSSAPALLEELQNVRAGQLDSLSALKADRARWTAVLGRSMTAVSREPIPKLQVMGRVEVPFLYDRRPPGFVTLRPGVAYCLRSFRGLVSELVHSSWLHFVRRWNPGFEPEERNLADFLFGSARTSLADARAVLMDAQNGRCFYCGKAARTFAVDHFIPWSLFPNDHLTNLVLADPSCNGWKRELLAAERHLERWAGRLASGTLDQLSAQAPGAPQRASNQSRRIALWAYAVADRGGSQVWLEGARLANLTDRWKSILDP